MPAAVPEESDWSGVLTMSDLRNTDSRGGEKEHVWISDQVWNHSYPLQGTSRRMRKTPAVRRRVALDCFAALAKTFSQGYFRSDGKWACAINSRCNVNIPLRHPEILRHASGHWKNAFLQNDRQGAFSSPLMGEGARAAAPADKGDTPHPRIRYGAGSILPQGERKNSAAEGMAAL